MAFSQLECYSDTLGVHISIWAILPQATSTQIGQITTAIHDKPPLLYLLHGLSDDHSVWVRKTSIERYAEEAGLAIIMPAVNRSFYCDMARGYRYWTFVSEELPKLVHQFFQVTDSPAKTFVAGLSMGGYGTFKLALRKPERFAAAASLSGFLDIVENERTKDVVFKEDADLCFPVPLRDTEDDLVFLAKTFAKRRGKKPLLYQCCGTEDMLLANNHAFLKKARALGIAITYEESPGDHEWGYWDQQIKRVIDWLPLGGSKKKKDGRKAVPG